VLRLRTFGGLELTRDSAPLSGAALQPRRLALLAIVAVAGRQGLSRDKILALLWPNVVDARGRQALSQAIYALKRDADADDMIIGNEQLRLNPDVVSSDIVEFQSAAAAGDDVRIAALYAGPFLDGVHITDGDEFERWAELQRLKFAQIVESSLERLAIGADASGNHDAAIAYWRRLTTLDPLKTRVAVRLISALAARGDRAEALRHADAYARLVREELDTEPSQEVIALADHFRSNVPLSQFGGRFVIERELGRGAMGVVYLARDVKHDRSVALKMLLPEVGVALGRDRLEREIIVTARLQHPHILALYDSGEVDGRLFYVMPYVDGESLRSRLARESTLPIEDAIRIAREVADALQHAHSRGVIHRDVKPENILLSGGHAIVADFGIARTVASAVGGTLTEHGFLIGTPAYMSPEQVAGDATIDGRSDLFSLGCVVYEMLTGRPPWIASSTHALLTRRFVEPPTPLRTLRPEVPRAVEGAVQRALALELDHRFATASEFSAALVATGERENPIPAPVGHLVGREQAIAAASALLRRPDVRAVTFTGAGGSGKTQLALHVATNISDSYSEAAFVDLSPLNDCQLVLAAIAHAVGAREQPGRSTLESIAMHLGSRSCLLVLDNFEHVIGAAGDISRLLSACSHLTVAVTSRVRLRIRGEHEFFVAPLPMPDLRSAPEVSQVRSAPAVELFVRRATEARPDFVADDAVVRTIAEICVQLDGLPLAIELAAARVRLLSPVAILARLDRRLELLTGGARDLPERHRTLRATIAASHDLLPARERQAWQRLAVFAGGCTLDTAAAVIDATEADTLNLVETLTDANLVRPLTDATAETRVTMLETIREFALEQLRASGEEDKACDRHRDVFRDIAERLSTDLMGDAQGRALTRLDVDRENFRSALEHAERTEASALMRLVLALWRYWLVRGEWTAGRYWLHRAIELAEAVVSPRDLAEALNAAGSLAQNQGDYPVAFASQERALGIWKDIGARDGEARTLTSMGWLAWRQCRYADARQLSVGALALHRELHDERGIAQALNNLGWVALFEGRYDESERHLQECIAIRRRHGDRRNIAFSLSTLGWAACRQGNLSRARSFIDEALRMFQEIGERQLYAFTTRVNAELALEDDRAAEARTMLETTSIPIFRAIGDRWGLAVALGVLADALIVEARTADAESANEEAMEIWLALGDHYGQASSHARAVVIAEARGEGPQVLERATEVNSRLLLTGGALGPFQRRMYDAAMSRLAVGERWLQVQQ
jgi:predicted ATPase/DNA-binding SARP family transcriptional activator